MFYWVIPDDTYWDFWLSSYILGIPHICRTSVNLISLPSVFLHVTDNQILGDSKLIHWTWFLHLLTGNVSFFFCFPLLFLKKRQQTQNVTICGKPTQSNQDLIPNLTKVSTSPRNKILTGQSGVNWSVLMK